MKKILLSIFCFITITSHAQNKNARAIKKMLVAQETAWNNGDLEKFMIGYWNNDSLLFIGKNGPKYGYNTTLANYKKRLSRYCCNGQVYQHYFKHKKA